MPVSPEELVQMLIEERVKIQAFIRSIVPDFHIAEDVFQEVSMLAFRESAKIKDRSHLLAWIRLAARHRALNAARRSNRKALPLDENLAAALDESWKQYDSRHVSDSAEALEHCMGRLSPSAQRIIQLRYTEGLTGDQLAKHLNRPTPSTYVTLSRVHRALERCIKERLQRPSVRRGHV